MTELTRAALLVVVLATGVAGCAPKRVQTSHRTGLDLAVLLPDPGTGAVGRAIVSNPSGTSIPAAARESTTIAPNGRPGAVSVMSEAEVTRIFGDALSALPPAPQHFTLFFRFESDELTEESQALLATILPIVKARLFPDVSVVGHTDTAGSRPSNVALGLKRATAVQALLIEAGMEPALIDVSSNGEADLLVKTSDEVMEPRNRRVEITVR